MIAFLLGPFVCLFARCPFLASFSYFWQLLFCADKYIINVIKVYIERNSMQVELMRFRKQISTLFPFTFAKRGAQCMCACASARVRACTHARMHACTHARMHACTHARMHACTHARMHACTHARMHACTHARMHACTHARMHACTHARMHACTHARMHACTHGIFYSPPPAIPVRRDKRLLVAR